MAYRFNVFTGTLDIIGGGSGGGVTGIAPTTPNAIATWVDVGATSIQNSKTLIQASGAIEAQGFITNRQVNGTVTVNSTESWISSSLEIQPGAVVVIQPGGQLILV